MTKKIFSFIPSALQQYTPIITKYFFIGFVIRILLMPVLSHGDLLTNGGVGYLIFKTGHMVNSDDPPLIAFIYAGLFALTSPFLPVDATRFLPIGAIGYSPTTLVTGFEVATPGGFILLFILKIPLLVADILGSFVFLRIFDDPRNAIEGFKLWMLSPVILLVTYGQGQFDIIAMAFFVVAIYFLKKLSWSSSALFVGISAAFKLFALFFLIPLALYRRSHGARFHLDKSMVLILILGLAPLAISVLVGRLIPPYYETANLALPNSEINGYFGKTLYYVGQAGALPLLSGLVMFFVNSSANFTLGIGTLYLFPLIYFAYLATFRYRSAWTYNEVIKSFAAILLVFYAVDSFLPQWFIFVQPLLLWLFSRRRNLLWVYSLLVILWITYTWYFDKDFTVSLLQPIFPLSPTWPGPQELLKRIGLSPLDVLDLLHALFSALCLVLSGIFMWEIFSQRTAVTAHNESDYKTTISTGDGF